MLYFYAQTINDLAGMGSQFAKIALNRADLPTACAIIYGGRHGEISSKRQGYTDMNRADYQYSAETKHREGLAPLYWVVMHNDPVTTMDFVVMILKSVFKLDHDKAVGLMYCIHYNGLEYISLMPLERAEFKVESVHTMARAQCFPLTCTIEPE